MSRKKSEALVPVTSFWVETAKIALSGTSATALTGTLDKGTNLNLTLTFPAPGTVMPSMGNMLAPTGSVLATIPGGDSVFSIPNGRYMQIMSWHAQLEPGGQETFSATPGGAPALGAGTSAANANASSSLTIDAYLSNATQYEVIQLGHVAASGTFLLCVTKLTGGLGSDAIRRVGVVPADLANPAGAACRINITFCGRTVASRA